MTWLSKLFGWFKFIQQARTVAFQHELTRANQGHAAAQYSLGERYHDGLGVPKDLPVAFDWFRQAAQRGHARAQANVGLMLFLGRGVKPDWEEAYKWIELSAQGGEPKSVEALRKLTAKLTPEQIEEGQRRARAFRDDSPQEQSHPKTQGSQ